MGFGRVFCPLARIARDVADDASAKCSFFFASSHVTPVCWKNVPGSRRTFGECCGASCPSHRLEDRDATQNESKELCVPTGRKMMKGKGGTKSRRILK